MLLLPASIPTPSWNAIPIGPFEIKMYALCILAGIVAAVFITNARLVNRGGERWQVVDIALFAVVFGIVGARIWHVLTHPTDYFGPTHEFWHVFAIWEGGIAIFGALVGGGLGVYVACRITGMRFLSFADALIPGLLVAQALGRLGNWFNGELFGTPTDVPWGLVIAPDNLAYPVGLPAGTLFHPMFLYELLWNLLGVVVILALERMFRLRWGKVFALYLMWYGVGRFVFEAFRLDPSEVFLGLRSNAWAALIAFIVGVILFIVQSRRHPGVEPSIYKPGRDKRQSDAAVDSANDDELFVDHGNGALTTRS